MFSTISRLFFFFSLCSTVCTYQVSLYDSSSMPELGWTLVPSQETWLEESWNLADKGNIRIYGSCPNEMMNISHWLILPPVDVENLKTISFDLIYTVRLCSGLGVSVLKGTCVEYITFHLREMNEAQYKDYLQDPNFRSKDTQSVSFYNQWKHEKLVPSLTKPDYEQVVLPYDLKSDTKYVQVAYSERNGCASTMVTRVFYDKCDVGTHNFAKYNETTAPGKSEISGYRVEGECVPNASWTQIKPEAICSPTGVWSKHFFGDCACLPGYFADVRNNKCLECPSGTYKPLKGAHQCEKCPENSQQSATASSHCVCHPGFFRASQDAPSMMCTKPPSSPTNLRSVIVNETTVDLHWDEPTNLGGRNDLYYEWQCAKGDCLTIRATPADKQVRSRMIRLTNLIPDMEYTFNIFAKNGVSSKAENPSSSYRPVDVQTKSLSTVMVDGLRVDGEMKGGVTLAWNPPSEGPINKYEIEIYCPALGLKETKESHSPSYTVSNLRTRKTYFFKVRVQQEGWSQWSHSLEYEAGSDAYNTNHGGPGTSGPETTALDSIPPWVIAMCTILIVIMLAFVLLICRRNNRNRKQMSDLDVLDTYKQDTMTPDYSSSHRPFNDLLRSARINAPLIPSYGSAVSQPPPYYGGPNNGKFKPYVDPTAYEDPNQALTEFTFDIDPAAVYITHVIGGGEFGDVCMGGLKKSLIGDSNDVTTETVAIKTLKPGSGGKAKADFLLEASIMGQFCHPHVVKLIGVVTRAEPAMIVTEYMENGSLDHFLRGKDAQGVDIGWPHVVNMLRGIASGMKYLTDKGYVHRDLAARNVLVDAGLNCKIADFGLSRGVDDTTDGEYTTNGGKIPVRWTAPEAITHRKFTAASDVWSFGVLAWEVCSFGERPYWDWTNQKVISEIMAGYRLPAPMDCPQSIHRIMMWCWKLERHDRPSFAQLLAILEKYARNPEFLFTDTTTLCRNNPNQVDMTYGAVRSPAAPPPPTGSPPTYPQLDDFLRSLGMGHTTEKLNKSGVYTVGDLSRKSHLDMLAIGMISEEFQRIREALHKLQLSRGLSRPELVATLNRTPNSRNRQEEGFFV